MPTLDFIGKSDVISHHLTVSYHELVVNKKKSLNSDDIQGNLIIHGDSLPVLKSLIPLYSNKIECVYLDFPYNTGNEGWVYNDNTNSPTTKEWLEKKVDREDQTRHDKWLCMVYPRLSLVRELMADNGIVILSIDDNEACHLKLVLDEIFGEENFIGMLPTIMNLKGNQDQFGFAGTHEYTLVYAKGKEQAKIGNFELNEEELDGWMEDEIGPYKQGAGLIATGINAPREKRPTLYFPIFLTDDNRPYVTNDDKPKNATDRELLPITSNQEMSWYWKKQKIREDVEDIIVKENGNGATLYKKQRPELGESPSKKPKTILYKPRYSSGNGTNLLKKIFGKKVFDYPKPLELIKDLLSITTSKDSIVLDATGGSGVTGHAVLDLNESDGGNRKFIIIECSDYADSVTAERIRKIIKGVPNTKYADGVKGGFSYLELGQPINATTLLSQDKMPKWQALAQHVYWLGTGHVIQKQPKENKDYYVGSWGDRHVYLFYKPDMEFMGSDEAMLKASQIYKIEKAHKDPKEIIIYAAGVYMGERELKKLRIDVARLPDIIGE